MCPENQLKSKKENVTLIIEAVGIVRSGGRTHHQDKLRLKCWETAKFQS